MLNHDDRFRPAWPVLVAVGRAAFLMVVMAGCASGGSHVRAPETRGSVDPGVRPGDAVRLNFWREDDMNGVFSVDDRGIITLPLIGDRQVAGLTPSELRGHLLEEYATYFKGPSIQVTVLRRLTILGAVSQPGLYTVDATISMSEALGLAGGLTPTADSDDIRIVRDGQVIRRTLDVATLVGEADIRSGDQVIIGEKGWLSRNPAALVGSLIAASAVVVTALIR